MMIKNIRPDGRNGVYIDAGMYDVPGCFIMLNRNYEAVMERKNVVTGTETIL